MVRNVYHYEKQRILSQNVDKRVADQQNDLKL